MAETDNFAGETVRLREDVRNVAIIAHVDHGKTTLVDRMLAISGVFRGGQPDRECVLDSNDLERERGITILAKNCSVVWKDVRINLLDTPGHADFGGEVERVLKMADACLLLVDAAEGPMPQTRFVLQKAFGHGLQPIVVINKIDRKDARSEEVLDEVYDLFIDIGAEDEVLDFPVLYGSGRLGYMMRSLTDEQIDITPLMDTIIEALPPPAVQPGAPLQLLVSSIEYDDFLGRIAVGRVFAGTIAEGQSVLLVKHAGTRVVNTVKRLFTFEALGRARREEVTAGDIVGLVGLEDVEIGDSVTCPETPRPLPPVEIEPPTITMMFVANDSPLRGKEGRFVSSRQLRERLEKELRQNVALRVEVDPDDQARFKVSGRGVMHLGVLLETMRREGYEIMVSKPEPILRRDDEGLKEPIEDLVVRVPGDMSGKVIEVVGGRRGELLRMEQKRELCHLEFRIPSRGLIGLRTRLLTSTRGEAMLDHVFAEYGPWRGEISGRQGGVQVSAVAGDATAYALFSLKDRGAAFIAPGDKVYEGMITGEHCKDNDIVVNPTRKKQLTNMRAAGSDDKVLLAPPKRLSLEEVLEYIAEDEYAEITPESIRLRKKLLKHKERKRKGQSAR